MLIYTRILVFYLCHYGRWFQIRAKEWHFGAYEKKNLINVPFRLIYNVCPRVTTTKHTLKFDMGEGGGGGIYWICLYT